MADNSTRVVDLKVSCVKVEELKQSAGGKNYLRMSFVHEDGDEKTWFSGVAFGVIAKAMSSKVKKGNKMKVTGFVSQREYVNKEGKPGVENKLVVNSAKVATGNEVLEFDEFST